MPPLPGQEEPIHRMEKIVNAFLTHAESGPFREPVDWRGLELHDYPQIIKHMMDLGTIKRKLDRGQYSTAHQVANDIRLVWRNCMTYNAENSDFWVLAKTFSRRFEDRYRKITRDCTYFFGSKWERSHERTNRNNKKEKKKKQTKSTRYNGICSLEFLLNFLIILLFSFGLGPKKTQTIQNSRCR